MIVYLAGRNGKLDSRDFNSLQCDALGIRDAGHEILGITNRTEAETGGISPCPVNSTVLN